MDNDLKYTFMPIYGDGTPLLDFRVIENWRRHVTPTLEPRMNCSIEVDKRRMECRRCDEDSYENLYSMGTLDKLPTDMLRRVLEFVLFPNGDYSLWKAQIDRGTQYSAVRPDMTIFRCTFGLQSELHGYMLTGKDGLTQVASACRSLKVMIAGMVHKQSNIHVLTCNRITSPRRCISRVFPRMLEEQLKSVKALVFKFNWDRDVVRAFMNNEITGVARRDLLTLQYFERFSEVESVFIEWIVHLPLVVEDDCAMLMMQKIVKAYFPRPTFIDIKAKCSHTWSIQP